LEIKKKRGQKKQNGSKKEARREFKEIPGKPRVVVVRNHGVVNLT